MSNLQLPTLTFGNLLELLGDKSQMRIGYETGAIKYSPPGWRLGTPYSVMVTRRGNVIADLYHTGAVDINNAGDRSSATRGRLNRVLRDNSLPFRVRRRDHVQELVSDTGWNSEFSFANFGHNGRLLTVNGSMGTLSEYRAADDRFRWTTN